MSKYKLNIGQLLSICPQDPGVAEAEPHLGCHARTTPALNRRMRVSYPMAGGLILISVLLRGVVTYDGD